MFVVPAEVVTATSSPDLAKSRHQAANWRSRDMGIAEKYLTDAALADLREAAQQLDHESFDRTVAAVQEARNGNFQQIPHIDSAAEMFREFLKFDLFDGWLYVLEIDRYLYPFVVIIVKMYNLNR